MNPKELRVEPKQILYTGVHCSIIYKSWKVETAQVSSNRCVNEQNAVHPGDGVLVSLKKERRSDTCFNTDGPGKLCWEK